MPLAETRLRARRRRRRRLRVLEHVRPVWLTRATLALAAGALLVRLAPDVEGKPLFEDEAVAGLIAARPLGEVLETVVWDRGGAPLHFVLAHGAFAVDGSPAALRWLSVACALATVVACYDLARRLAGEVAGATAAVVAASSGMLAVYGSFGRMYGVFAFVAALAADLFVRAVQLRTARAAALAAVAAWLLPATHPYGGIVVAVEAALALALWRGRNLAAALPVIAVGLATLPFAVADLRLADRFSVGVDERTQLATLDEVWRQVTLAIRGFAGGEGVPFVVFTIAGLAGAALLLSRQPAFVALAAVAFSLPPLLALVFRTGAEASASPRYLVFALPAWAALVGVAVERLARARGDVSLVGALVAVAVLAGTSSKGIVDPRSATYSGPLGGERALAAPRAWLRETVGEHDVLFPYSAVFLAALPETAKAVSLPRAQPAQLRRALEHARYPVRAVVVAVPSGDLRFAEEVAARRLGPKVAMRPFERWLLVRAEGPFADADGVLRAVARVLAATRAAAVGPMPAALAGYLRLSRAVVCRALRTPEASCPRG